MSTFSAEQMSLNVNQQSMELYDLGGAEAFLCCSNLLASQNHQVGLILTLVQTLTTVNHVHVSLSSICLNTSNAVSG